MGLPAIPTIVRTGKIAGKGAHKISVSIKKQDLRVQIGSMVYRGSIQKPPKGEVIIQAASGTVLLIENPRVKLQK